MVGGWCPTAISFGCSGSTGFHSRFRQKDRLRKELLAVAHVAQAGKLLRQASKEILDSLDLADPYTHPENRLLASLRDKVQAIASRLQAEKQQRAANEAEIARLSAELDQQLAAQKAQRDAQNARDKESAANLFSQEKYDVEHGAPRTTLAVRRLDRRRYPKYLD